VNLNFIKNSPLKTIAYKILCDCKNCDFEVIIFDYKNMAAVEDK